MIEDIRPTGIDGVDHMPWGTHICHFYETTTDLLETLVPYFKAGLDNNEYCIWVFSEPLTAAETINALRPVVPAIDRHLSNHDIMIVSHRDWYLRGGTFNLQTVLRGWRQQVDEALAKGYAGLRVTDDIVWEEQNECNNLAEYERAIDDSISELRMRALCTYALGNCGATQVFDVMGTHQFALARRSGELEVVETSETKNSKAEIQRLNRELEGRVVERSTQLATANEELRRESVERRRTDRCSAAFATLARKLSGASVPLEAAKIIADTADELFGWDSCNINLYDADRDLLQPVLRIDTIDGRRADVISLAAEHKPTARSRRLIEQSAGLTLREEPCAFDEDSVPFGDTTRPSAAIMDVLIRHAAEIIGTLSLQSYTPRSYDQDALNNLQALAEHCGEALNRIRAEQALRESEERYRDLIENSQDLFCTHDLDGRLLSANRAVEKLLGYTPEEFEGKNVREILAPESRDRFDDYLEVIRNEGIASGTMLVQTSAGERRIWEYYNTLRTEGVAAPIVRGMARDITERKRAEDALRASESLRRTIIESEPDCVKLVAPDCTLLDMNPAGLAMIGASSREQVIGKSVLALIAPECRAAFREMHERVCHGESVVAEFEIVGLNGVRRWMETHAAPLRNTDSNVIAQLAIAHDITERKRAEESLKVFRALIDQSNDAIEVIDPHTFRFLDCNQSAYQSLGYTREEFLTLSVFDIDPLVDRESIAQLDEQMETSGFVTLESIHRRKDGSTFPVEINVKVVRLERDYRLAMVRDITGRKRAEEALRLAEQKYRDIFENASEGVSQTTREGRFLTANPELARMLGYESAEELILNRIDIEHQHYVDPLRRQEFKRLVEGNGFLRDFEYEAYRKDGSKLWITTNVRAVRDEDGTLLYYEGTVQDITDRKFAEVALIKQKEILEKIVEHIPVMINFVDSDGRIRLVNREWQKTLGWSLEEVLNDDLDVLAETYPNPEDYQKVLAFIGAAEGEWADFKTRIKDGTVIDTSWARVKLSDGTTIGIGQDITERKRAEEALREAEQKYRELFENAKDAIYVHDLNGRYTSINPAAEALTGYSRDEILGRHFTDFIPPEYLRPARKSLCRKLKEAGETSYEIEVITKDRRRVPLEVNSRLIRRNGEAVGVQGTARDITERKRAQEAMRSYSRRLIEAQETERQNIARELHDEIGQILTAVRLNLQSAQRSSGTETFLPRIEDSIVVVDEAVKRVRELSLQLRPALLDDLGLTAALRWYADRYAQRTGFAVEVLDDCETGGRIHRELETACFRIAQEGLTNIARHTQATRVLVEIKCVKGRLTLVIKDNGAGFDVDALFKNVSAGAALGLRGMEERALAVGGQFAIKSTAGQGTEVRVSFPLTRKR
jgi:PAS domain S-box-containing protein